jgi:hypothetical protein
MTAGRPPLSQGWDGRGCAVLGCNDGDSDDGRVRVTLPEFTDLTMQVDLRLCRFHLRMVQRGGIREGDYSISPMRPTEIVFDLLRSTVENPR